MKGYLVSMKMLLDSGTQFYDDDDESSLCVICLSFYSHSKNISGQISSALYLVSKLCSSIFFCSNLLEKTTDEVIKAAKTGDLVLVSTESFFMLGKCQNCENIIL